MRYLKLIALLLTTLCFVDCEKVSKNAVEEIDNDSTHVNDSLITDTAEYICSGKGLNDIRFADFDENNWQDNGLYVVCEGILTNVIVGR
ncbi:MAG: hypothetical protein UH685_06400 [Bacteroidaceae bacterium]|nr:hypothetical protein [Bacteroidaceae bacterium]